MAAMIETAIMQFSVSLKARITNHCNTQQLLRRLHLFPRLADLSPVEFPTVQQFYNHDQGPQPEELQRRQSQLQRRHSESEGFEEPSPERPPSNDALTVTALITCFTAFANFIHQSTLQPKFKPTRQPALRRRKSKRRSRLIGKKRYRVVTLRHFMPNTSVGRFVTTPPFSDSSSQFEPYDLIKFPPLPTDQAECQPQATTPSHDEISESTSSPPTNGELKSPPQLTRTKYTEFPRSIPVLSSPQPKNVVACCLEAAYTTSASVQNESVNTLTAPPYEGIFIVHSVDQLGRRHQDWRCPCRYLNFAARTECRRCLRPKITAAPPTPEQPPPKTQNCVVQ